MCLEADALDFEQQWHIPSTAYKSIMSINDCYNDFTCQIMYAKLPTFFMYVCTMDGPFLCSITVFDRLHIYICPCICGCCSCCYCERLTVFGVFDASIQLKSTVPPFIRKLSGGLGGRNARAAKIVNSTVQIQYLQVIAV